jgi:hypothetical protein
MAPPVIAAAAPAPMVIAAQAAAIQPQAMNVTMGATALANPEPELAPAPIMQPAAEAPPMPVRAPPSVATPIPPPVGRQQRGGLFAEPPGEAASTASPAGPSREDMARPTLFSRITGRLRGQADTPPAPQPEPAQRRTEPTMQPEPRVEPVRAAVRPAGNEEMGILDIPTFLRRQSS